MGKYATNTNVSAAKSRAEIENIVTRYGAEKYLSGVDNELGEALIGFQVGGTQIRMVLRLPRLEEFAKTESGRRRNDKKLVDKAHEQACRSSWRSLALVVKAKFEAVESGITTLQEEFLSHVVVPGGKTIGQTIIPQLGSYSASELPKLLPGRT
jgi:hypothetical protein